MAGKAGLKVTAMGERSGQSYRCLCQRHLQCLVCKACALPSTACSPLLSTCGDCEKLELIYAVSFSGNIICSD